MLSIEIMKNVHDIMLAIANCNEIQKLVLVRMGEEAGRIIEHNINYANNYQEDLFIFLLHNT